MSKKADYSGQNINEVSWNMHIRLRPGMYLGRVDQKGLVETMKGFFSALFYRTNSSYFCFEILGDKKGKFTIARINNEIEIELDEWIKYNSDFVFLEMHTINALSSKFEIRFFDSNSSLLSNQKFEKGELVSESPLKKIVCSKIEIEFMLDEEVWGDNFSWNETYLTHQIREFAYLYKRVEFELRYKINKKDCRIIYHFKNGLKDRLDIEKLNGLGNSYFETNIDEKIDNVQVEIAFAFREYTVDESYLKSYVNDHYTHENGSHVDGLLKGLTYGVMKYFQKHDLVDKYKISEKGIKNNLIAAINIRMDQPLFSGCVKNKLANPEIIEPIANYVSELLFRKIEADEKSTEKLIQKFKI